MWRDRSLTVDRYAELCESCPISAGYAPRIVEYYFSRLGLKPRFVALHDRHGSLIGAFPSLYRIVFPTALHVRLLGRSMVKLGYIGQPESLFPVLPGTGSVALNHVSPTTSPLLRGRVRSIGSRSLKAMAIARDRKHKKLSARARAFAQEGGKAYYTEDIAATEFADAYIQLHCRRWRLDPGSLTSVREQIVALYSHVHGVLLTMNDKPVAVQLCYRHVGPLYYVDFLNSGVELTDDNTVSYGSIMMLLCLRRAEEQAKALGRPLRFSYGFLGGDGGYKQVWTDPEPTFVGI